MEEWKEIKSINTAIFTNIKCYFSNKGRVKLVAYYKDHQLDEELLSLGHCMYIYKGEINVYMIGGSIYRNMYKLFVGDIPKGYQIHHKDYNHYNNSVDNLECLNAKEHGKRHGWQMNLMWYDMSNNKEYMTYNDSINKMNDIQQQWKDYTKEDASNDLKSIYKRFDDKHREYSKQLLEQKKQQNIERNKQNRQKEIEDKLATGNYKYEDGKLICINKPKWNEDRRNKTMKTRESSKAWSNRKEKISDSLKEYYSQPENREKQLQQLANIREIRLNNLN